MRTHRAIGITALVAGLALSAPSVQAADYATTQDFWQSAAAVSTATVYEPSAKALRGAGLSQPGSPVSGAFLEMICAGQWNTSITYDSRDAESSASLYQATPGCTPDFGAGEAKGKWTFKVSGRTFTTQYQDCRGTAEGAPAPVVAECPAEDAIYATFGRLPAVGSQKATFVHLDTEGLTRAQIRTFMRSLDPVR